MFSNWFILTKLKLLSDIPASFLRKLKFSSTILRTNEIFELICKNAFIGIFRYSGICVLECAEPTWSVQLMIRGTTKNQQDLSFHKKSLRKANTPWS